MIKIIPAKSKLRSTWNYNFTYDNWSAEITTRYLQGYVPGDGISATTKLDIDGPGSFYSSGYLSANVNYQNVQYRPFSSNTGSGNILPYYETYTQIPNFKKQMTIYNNGSGFNSSTSWWLELRFDCNYQTIQRSYIAQIDQCDAPITANSPVNYYDGQQYYQCQIKKEENSNASSGTKHKEIFGITFIKDVTKKFNHIGVEDAGLWFHYRTITAKGAITDYKCKIPNAYQIKYDSQFGSNVNSSDKIFTGFNQSVTNNKPTRSGYRFDGWYTSPNGVGTKYNAGNLIKLTSDVTLYANWIPLYSILTNATNGTITNSVYNIEPNVTKIITYNPISDDYYLKSLIIDEINKSAISYPNSYTFLNINENHSITANYTNYHHITTIAINGGDSNTLPLGGAITASDSKIKDNESRTVTYTPKTGYYVAKVIVDGKELNLNTYPTSYSFTNIMEDHIAIVDFRKLPTVEITKSIQKSNANLSTGNPVFQFKIEGTDYLGKKRSYTKYLEFSESELSGIGLKEKTLTITDLISGIYKITEQEVKNYALVKIQDKKNTVITNNIVNINTYIHYELSYQSISSLKGKQVNADSDSKANMFEEK